MHLAVSERSGDAEGLGGGPQHTTEIGVAVSYCAAVGSGSWDDVDHARGRQEQAGGRSAIKYDEAVGCLDHRQARWPQDRAAEITDAIADAHAAGAQARRPCVRSLVGQCRYRSQPAGADRRKVPAASVQPRPGPTDLQDGRYRPLACFRESSVKYITLAPAEAKAMPTAITPPTAPATAIATATAPAPAKAIVKAMAAATSPTTATATSSAPAYSQRREYRPSAPVAGCAAPDLPRDPSAVLDALQQTPSTTPLLTAQEAKDRLREIVEGFFFRRRNNQAQPPVRHLLIRSPPGLRKTKEAMEWATRYPAYSLLVDGD